MAETEIHKVTKFKYFTSLQKICKLLNSAVMKENSKFIGGYFWVNSDFTVGGFEIEKDREITVELTKDVN